jgi:GT2 family glycosyltransferase
VAKTDIFYLGRTNLDNMSAITFVIPTYAGEDTIEETIKSIYEQSLSESDISVIVVVDEAGVDNTVELLQQEYPNVELHTFSENRGHAAALNRGIQYAETEFVALCDDDIQFPTDWGETLLNEFKSLPPEVAVLQPRIIEPDYERAEFGDIDRFQSSGVLARRAAIKQAGYFDEDYFVYRDDYQLSAALLNSGYRIVGVDSTVTYHDGTHTDVGLPPLKAYYETRNEIWNLWRYQSRPLALLNTFYWIPSRLMKATRSGTVSETLKGILAGISRPQYLLSNYEYCPDQSHRIFLR